MWQLLRIFQLALHFITIALPAIAIAIIIIPIGIQFVLGRYLACKLRFKYSFPSTIQSISLTIGNLAFQLKCITIQLRKGTIYVLINGASIHFNGLPNAKEASMFIQKWISIFKTQKLIKLAIKVLAPFARMVNVIISDTALELAISPSTCVSTRINRISFNVKSGDCIGNIDICNIDVDGRLIELRSIQLNLQCLCTLSILITHINLHTNKKMLNKQSIIIIGNMFDYAYTIYAQIADSLSITGNLALHLMGLTINFDKKQFITLSNLQVESNIRRSKAMKAKLSIQQIDIIYQQILIGYLHMISFDADNIPVKEVDQYDISSLFDYICISMQCTPNAQQISTMLNSIDFDSILGIILGIKKLKLPDFNYKATLRNMVAQLNTLSLLLSNASFDVGSSLDIISSSADIGLIKCEIVNVLYSKLFSLNLNYKNVSSHDCKMSIQQILCSTECNIKAINQFDIAYICSIFEHFNLQMPTQMPPIQFELIAKQVTLSHILKESLISTNIDSITIQGSNSIFYMKIPHTAAFSISRSSVQQIANLGSVCINMNSCLPSFLHASIESCIGTMSMPHIKEIFSSLLQISILPRHLIAKILGGLKNFIPSSIRVNIPKVSLAVVEDYGSNDNAACMLQCKHFNLFNTNVSEQVSKYSYNTILQVEKFQFHIYSNKPTLGVSKCSLGASIIVYPEVEKIEYGVSAYITTVFVYADSVVLAQLLQSIEPGLLKNQYKNIENKDISLGKWTATGHADVGVCIANIEYIVEHSKQLSNILLATGLRIANQDNELYVQLTDFSMKNNYMGNSFDIFLYPIIEVSIIVTQCYYVQLLINLPVNFKERTKEIGENSCQHIYKSGFSLIMYSKNIIMHIDSISKSVSSLIKPLFAMLPEFDSPSITLDMKLYVSAIKIPMAFENCKCCSDLDNSLNYLLSSESVAISMHYSQQNSVEVNGDFNGVLLAELSPKILVTTIIPQTTILQQFQKFTNIKCNVSFPCYIKPDLFSKGCKAPLLVDPLEDNNLLHLPNATYCRSWKNSGEPHKLTALSPFVCFNKKTVDTISTYIQEYGSKALTPLPKNMPFFEVLTNKVKQSGKYIDLTQIKYAYQILPFATQSMIIDLIVLLPQIHAKNEFDKYQGILFAPKNYRITFSNYYIIQDDQKFSAYFSIIVSIPELIFYVDSTDYSLIDSKFTQFKPCWNVKRIPEYLVKTLEIGNIEFSLSIFSNDILSVCKLPYKDVFISIEKFHTHFYPHTFWSFMKILSVTLFDRGIRHLISNQLDVNKFKELTKYGKDAIGDRILAIRTMIKQSPIIDVIKLLHYDCHDIQVNLFSDLDKNKLGERFLTLTVDQAIGDHNYNVEHGVQVKMVVKGMKIYTYDASLSGTEPMVALNVMDKHLPLNPIWDGNSVQIYVKDSFVDSFDNCKWRVIDQIELVIGPLDIKANGKIVNQLSNFVNFQDSKEEEAKEARIPIFFNYFCMSRIIVNLTVEDSKSSKFVFY